MKEVENTEWWTPNERVSEYKFGGNINDIPSFIDRHHVETRFSQTFENEITHSYSTNDKAYSLLVTNNLIDSVSCHSKFIVKENIIGEHLSEAIIQLVRKFGKEKCIFKFDCQVEYDDGEIQMDVDFDQLGLGITTNLNGIIMYASVLNYS